MQKCRKDGHVGSSFFGSLVDLLKQHALGAVGVRLVIWGMADVRTV
jgi:hypothetical protein